MKKTLLLCLSLFACAVSLFASMSLAVKLKSGAEVTFALSESPRITFSDGNLVVNESASYTYSMSNVLKYSFKESSSTPVKEAGGDASSSVTFSRQGDVFTVEGLPSGVEAHVYGMFGGVVGRAKSDAYGMAKLDLSTLGAGVYVLSAGGSSVKVTKR